MDIIKKFLANNSANKFYAEDIIANQNPTNVTNQFTTKKRSMIVDHPFWTEYRIGQSETILPDGRHVFIAGEYEDYYDPDFFIYNDVFVVDPLLPLENSVVIYGYPYDIFPPTDFHKAILVNNHIWIIGSIGYDVRKKDHIQICVLDTTTWKMELKHPTAENDQAYPPWMDFSIEKNTCIYNEHANEICINDTWVLHLNTCHFTLIK